MFFLSVSWSSIRKKLYLIANLMSHFTIEKSDNRTQRNRQLYIDMNWSACIYIYFTCITDTSASFQISIQIILCYAFLWLIQKKKKSKKESKQNCTTQCHFTNWKLWIIFCLPLSHTYIFLPSISMDGDNFLLSLLFNS